MTNEEYVYRQEIKDRSRIAQSAHKAYSKRRRGCRLPADNMTKKELTKMNGPIQSITLNAPVSWADFRKVSQDMQKEYIKNVLAKYAIGPKAFADMFKIDVGYCSKYLKSLGFTFGKGHGATRDETLRFFNEFCTAEIKEKKPPAASALRQNAFALNTVSLSFTGPFTPDIVADALAKLFPTGETVRIDLTVTRVADVAL